MQKTISALSTAFITLSIFSVLALHSCRKEKSNCYDAALAEEYKNRACTTDCPGVTGCDGKTYCNACDAASKGIRVQ
jgi:hypothetical protein